MSVRNRIRGWAIPIGACAAVLGAGALLFLVWTHNVPLRVIETDRAALEAILAADSALLEPSPTERTFGEEIQIVRTIQSSVLRVAPLRKAIPRGQPREPADLLRAGRGLCYDRVRTMEKGFREAGFDVRHAALYSTEGGWLGWLCLFRPGVPSHAVAEVRTSRGWLVVDPNHAWVSLDSDGLPLGLRELRAAAGEGRNVCEQPPPEPILRSPFFYVYGLYSRHGGFYPPYTPFPDVNLPELTLNLSRP